MRVFRDIERLPEFKNAVLTIGTYDGVHTGHQKIINRINQLAADNDGESVILTFHPHPRLVLNPGDTSLKLINTLEEKIKLLEHYKVDNLVIAPFSIEFSKLPAEAYVKNFLWETFHPKIVCIGYNHRFGNNREGDIHLIREMALKLGFKVEEISKQIVEDITVSSTKIRKALLAGKVDVASSLLGHNFSIIGKVVKGQQVGQQIGFPTANIEIDNPNKLIPANGVYAVKIKFNEVEHSGMLNIGMRPTFNGKNETIEVHIFDFEDDIYGKAIHIEFIASIREEQKFDSVDELVQQLKIDREQSKKILNYKF